MIEKLSLHFSFTNPASVHDEEALTALELAGRQGAKINEIIDSQNKMPEMISKEMQGQIDKGVFDEAIDEHYSEISERIDNLTKNVKPGTSSMDAMIFDAMHNRYTDKSYQTLKIRLDSEYLELKNDSACAHSVYFESTPIVEYKREQSIKLTANGVTSIFFGGAKYDVENLSIVRNTNVTGALYKVAFYPESMTFAIYHHSEKIPLKAIFIGLIYENKCQFVNELIGTYGDNHTENHPKYVNVILHGEPTITKNVDSFDVFIPSFSLLWKSMEIIIAEETITVNGALAKQFIYYDITNEKIVIGSATSTETQLCIGYLDSKGIHIHAYNSAEMDARYRVAILPSSKSKFITINTETKTITFPADTLAIYKNNVFGQIGGPSTNTPFTISYAHLTTSAINIWIDRTTHIPFALPYYSTPLNHNSLLFTLRTNTGICDLSVPYTVNGKLMNVIPVNDMGEMDIPGVETKTDDSFFYSIAHRGLSAFAPENTLPAFEKAKENGFKYIECDVRITSDGVPVLIHDETVDRTSNGTGKVSELTYAQLLELDFGSWFSPEFAGTQVLSLQDFLIWCRDNGMIPFIECKERPYQLENWLYAYGLDKTAFVGGFDIDTVNFYTNRFNTFMIYDSLDIDEYMSNIPFSNCNYSRTQLLFVGDYNISPQCLENIFEPYIYWTCDDANTIKNLPNYISGVVSNSLHGGKVKKGG